MPEAASRLSAVHVARSREKELLRLFKPALSRGTTLSLLASFNRAHDSSADPNEEADVDKVDSAKRYVFADSRRVR